MAKDKNKESVLSAGVWLHLFDSIRLLQSLLIKT